jgi:type II secretory pathway component PulJ
MSVCAIDKSQQGFILASIMTLLCLMALLTLTALHSIDLQWRNVQQLRQRQRQRQALANALIKAQQRLRHTKHPPRLAPLTFQPRQHRDWRPYSDEEYEQHWHMQLLYQPIAWAPCMRLSHQAGHGLQFYQLSIHALEQQPLIMQVVEAIPQPSQRQCHKLVALSHQQRSWYQSTIV